MFNEMFTKSVKFEYDGSKNPYINLSEYAEETGAKSVIVKGVWINPKAKYGPRACLVAEGININLPTHINKDVEKILSTEGVKEAIDNGKCAFDISTYEKDGKTFYSGRFRDN